MYVFLIVCLILDLNFATKLLTDRITKNNADKVAASSSVGTLKQSSVVHQDLERVDDFLHEDVTNYMKNKSVSDPEAESEEDRPKRSRKKGSFFK